MSFFLVYLERSQMDKVHQEQRKHWYILSSSLTAWSSSGNVKQSRDERSVASGRNCWHLISFHSRFWSYFCHRMFYIYVDPISRHLCFSPWHQPWKHNTCYHANCSLWAICSAVVGCSLFEPIPSVSPQISPPKEVQREALLFRPAQGRSVWLCCDCCLFYHYSSLPQKT